MKQTQKISSLQLFFFILQSQVGISVLSMPHAIFRIAKTDSWLVVILSGLFVQILIFILWLLAKRFPDNTIFEVQEELLGKTLGKLLTIAYSIYFILSTSIILVLFSDIIKLWLLPTTPGWIITLLMLSISVYMVKENLRILSRFFVITAIFFLFFFILSLYSFKYANVLYILPIGKEGFFSILKGSREGIRPFQGVEMLLILFPYVQATAITKLKAITYANICTTFLYTVLTVSCIVFFSPKELLLIPQPVLYVIKSFELSIIERPDILFTSSWIIIVASTVMSFLYATSKGMTYVLSYSRKTFTYWGALVIYIITIVCHQPSAVHFLSKLVSSCVLIFAVGIPIVLLILAIILKKSGQPGEFS
ncbi:GerAB/ArcD/ProY family transporter [Bacillus toyonensis]|uniref:GerAB/ArcD/ProY family transporter n=1 Tax=Bacillus toyonensis TaxID=155322 RepID=UPI0015D4DC42|nr:GerAB/ArcD/ProY family transporter [Bacillus toyonensis]